MSFLTPQSQSSEFNQRPLSHQNHRARALVRSTRDAQTVAFAKLTMLMLAAFVMMALTLALFTHSARADEAPAATVSSDLEERMHSIIAAQIDAFRAEDAETAYSYASPAIKRRFSNAQRFASMVERGYPAVYSAQSYEFIESALTPRGPAQMIEIVAPDGQIWGGIYTFSEDDEGSLSISGVYLRRQNAQQI